MILHERELVRHFAVTATKRKRAVHVREEKRLGNSETRGRPGRAEQKSRRVVRRTDALLIAKRVLVLKVCNMRLAPFV
jgi:hypothetical protein